MLNILRKKNTISIKEKEQHNKVLFSPSTKKKIISKAARESAEDQRKVLNRYRNLVSIKS